MHVCIDGESSDHTVRPFYCLTTVPFQIFRREHFFRGTDNDDQLLRIMQALGTDRFDQYLSRYNIHFETEHEELLMEYVPSSKPASMSILTPCFSYPRQPWVRFVSQESLPYTTVESLDLLDKLLRYDHQERLTAQEAQAHTYFSESPRYPGLPHCLNPRFQIL